MTGDPSQYKKKMISFFPRVMLLMYGASFTGGQSILGKTSCPCIDATRVLSPIANCGGEYGLTPVGVTINRHGRTICVPLNYGTSCQNHDLTNDPKCFGGDDHLYASKNVSDVPGQADLLPDYCKEQWCYVDKTQCKNSSELLYRSDSFSKSNLFYSYSTCNSTAHSWRSFQTTQSIEDKLVQVTIPELWYPAIYKETEDKNMTPSSSIALYRNDSIPWKGLVIDYLNAIGKMSNTTFNFTHRSGGADKISTNTYTAAVYDVQVGISGMAASLFWVTSERLRMTAFSTPLMSDKTFLWVGSGKRSKASSEGFIDYAGKLAKPFDKDLWILICFMVILVSITAVCFSSDAGTFGVWSKRFNSDAWRNTSMYHKFLTMMKVLLDSFLAHATLFFTGSTDVNLNGLLSQRIFMTGFSFIVLIVISSYTANLASFLTISSANGLIQSIDEAGRICAHPVLREDLEISYPNADFYFNDEPGSDLYLGMVESYKNGKCDVMAISTLDAYNRLDLMGSLCELDIVVTNILLTETPIAFPIDKSLLAGMSHMMVEGEKRQIKFSEYEQSGQPGKPCSLKPKKKNQLLVPLSPAHMALPFVAFISSLLVAGIIHLYNGRKMSTTNSYYFDDDYEFDEQEQDNHSFIQGSFVQDEQILNHTPGYSVPKKVLDLKEEPVITDGFQRQLLIETLKKIQSQHGLIRQMLFKGDHIT